MMGHIRLDRDHVREPARRTPERLVRAGFCVVGSLMPGGGRKLTVGKADTQAWQNPSGGRIGPLEYPGRSGGHSLPVSHCPTCVFSGGDCAAMAMADQVLTVFGRVQQVCSRWFRSLGPTLEFPRAPWSSGYCVLGDRTRRTRSIALGVMEGSRWTRAFRAISFLDRNSI
jgi:hypothetical protein